MFHASRKSAVARRTFLRASGVALSLPWLDAMVPAFATRAEAAAANAPPKRFIAMQYDLGFHTPFLFPEKAGADYEMTPYLEMLAPRRADFTVISGISHPDQRGANGHTSELTWLTGARHPGLPGFRNTISFDQYLVERIGTRTRFPHLALSCGHGGSLAWTGNGVNLPADMAPSSVFKRLFVNGTPAEVKQQVRELKRGKSILDTVQGQAKQLDTTLGTPDRQKLDQYFTAVRDLENRLTANEAWAAKPKQTVTEKPPTDVMDRTDILAKTRLMNDLVTLALKTDSTRIITYKGGGFNAVPKIDGVQTDWHMLSHHGLDPAKIQELKTIELAEFRELNRFLTVLADTKENGSRLLDNTTVVFGSNLGNASAHDSTNIPMIVAGGGFTHGRHLAFDRKNNAPFAALFVNVAQKMGVETDTFAYANGTLKGM